MGYQYNKQKGCSGKIGYTNIQEANGMGRTYMVERKQQLFIYLCSFCNKWHLTHKESKYKVI
jgi:hypothetical protein